MSKPIVVMDTDDPDEVRENVEITAELFARIGTVERIVKLPRGYQVRMVFNGETGFSFRWKPDIPTFKSPDVERRFWKKYYTARNSFCQDITDALVAPITLNGRDGASIFMPNLNPTKH